MHAALTVPLAATHPGPVVRRFVPADLPQLGQIRTGESEGGLASRLPEAWSTMLAAYAREPSTILLVAVEENRVLGYALATPRPLAIQRRAAMRSPSLWAAAGLDIVRHPTLLPPLIRRARRLLRPVGISASRPDPTLRLLDIVVAERARGRGVGRTLLAALLMAAAADGHVDMGLSVLADNQTAIRLYERAGFATDAEGVRDDGRRYLTMRAALSSAP